MDGSITIGIISINEIDDLKLIKLSNRLSNLFHKYYPNIITETKYNKLKNICLYRYEADIIVNFNKKKIIKYDNYLNEIYKIFIEYSNNIKKSLIMILYL